MLGKWISENLLAETLNICAIQKHELCQMINHNEHPNDFYWRHYKSVDTIDVFMECMKPISRKMINNTISFIKTSVDYSLNWRRDGDGSMKELIAFAIYKHENNVTMEEIHRLFQCYLVIYLHTAPREIISALYKSITGRTYFLGYGGIQFIFIARHEVATDKFFQINSCANKVTIFLFQEMRGTLLQSYVMFKQCIDAQLGCGRYNTA